MAIDFLVDENKKTKEEIEAIENANRQQMIKKQHEALATIESRKIEIVNQVNTYMQENGKRVVSPTRVMEIVSSGNMYSDFNYSYQELSVQFETYKTLASFLYDTTPRYVALLTEFLQFANISKDRYNGYKKSNDPYMIETIAKIEDYFRLALMKFGTENVASQNFAKTILEAEHGFIAPKEVVVRSNKANVDVDKIKNKIANFKVVENEENEKR